MRRRRQEGLLVDDAVRDAGVDPDRRRVDHPADPGVARRLQHVERPARVEVLGVGRLGLHLADVGGGGHVHDRVAAAHRAPDGVRVPDVGDRRLDLAAAVVGRRAQVEDDRLVPCGEQAVDDVRADEAGAAGHQDAGHVVTSGR